MVDSVNTPEAKSATRMLELARRRQRRSKLRKLRARFASATSEQERKILLAKARCISPFASFALTDDVTSNLVRDRIGKPMPIACDEDIARNLGEVSQENSSTNYPKSNFGTIIGGIAAGVAGVAGAYAATKLAAKAECERDTACLRRDQLISELNRGSICDTIQPIRYVGSEAHYKKWIQQRPNGAVLNFVQNGLVLHRSTCSGVRRVGTQKYCFESLADMKRWAVVAKVEYTCCSNCDSSCEAETGDIG